jgi:hypothetical protein
LPSFIQSSLEVLAKHGLDAASAYWSSLNGNNFTFFFDSQKEKLSIEDHSSGSLNST